MRIPMVCFGQKGKGVLGGVRYDVAREDGDDPGELLYPCDAREEIFGPGFSTRKGEAAS